MKRHVAGTYDGSVFRVFVDGKLGGSSAPGLEMTKGQPDIGIGSFRYGLVLRFSGKIDDVNIHDRALSEADIRRKAKEF
ncbi:MAG: LamG domain-containing protein [Lentisphaeria bacterium]|nr:LamG domain-containing protein [Lentisphaeria bacterium]